MKKITLIMAITGLLLTGEALASESVLDNRGILDHIAKNRSVKIAKDPFETSEEAAIRLAPLVKDFQVTLPIPGDDNSKERATLNYRADTETLSVRLNDTAHLSGFKSDGLVVPEGSISYQSFPVFVLEKRQSAQHTYRAKTNFGVEVPITAWTSSERDIIIVNLTSLRYDSVTQITLPRDAARSLFSNAAWRFTGKTCPVRTKLNHYLIDDGIHTEPSIQYLIDHVDDKLLLPVEVSKIELINLKTGDVIFTIDNTASK